MRNTLDIESPWLLDEWDYKRNGSMLPSNFTTGSNKKVWWKCKLGHVWEAQICKRVAGRNCPFCSGNRIWIGFNDLASQNPILASEWDHERNAYAPTDVTPNSGKKAWWRCKAGHIWEARIDHRNKGIGCPVCSRKRGYEGVNDIVTIKPDLAKEWHYIKNGRIEPNQVAVNSNKKYWWICSLGHEWQSTVNARSSGSGCPTCSGKIVLAGFNDLATKNPCLAKEWNYLKNGLLKPEMITVNSNQKVWWVCQSGHEWEATVNNRNSGRGCPVCSNRKVLTGHNDLFSQYPDLSSEWNYDRNQFPPSAVVSKSGRKVWWKCSQCGHEWKATVVSRVSGTGCPHCYSRNRTSFPEQAIFYYLKKAFPDAISRYTDIFKNGSELDIYLPVVNTGIEYDGSYWHKTTAEKDALKYSVCREHGIRLIRVKETKSNMDLEICDKCIYVEDSLDKAISELLEFLGASVAHNIQLDRMEILHSYYSAVRADSLAEKRPDLAEAWNHERNMGITPYMVYVFSNEKVWWRCRYGHEWEASVSNRSNLNRGCPYCSHQKANEGINDLETLFPELLKEWDFDRNAGVVPRSLLPGSNRKVWWKCSECGNNWATSVNHRTSGRGCPKCSIRIRSQARLKSVEQFNKETRLNSPKIEILDEYKGTGRKLLCRCVHCNYEWQATPSSLIKGTTCPACMNRVVIPGTNDLLSQYPDIAADWDFEKNAPLTPLDVVFGSSKKAWWRCKTCGYCWQDSIEHRTSGRMCKQCRKSINCETTV